MILRHPHQIDVDFNRMGFDTVPDGELWWGYWISRSSGIAMSDDSFIVKHPEEWYEITSEAPLP